LFGNREDIRPVPNPIPLIPRSFHVEQVEQKGPRGNWLTQVHKLRSVLQHCWMGDIKDIRPVKYLDATFSLGFPPRTSGGRKQSWNG